MKRERKKTRSGKTSRFCVASKPSFNRPFFNRPNGSAPSSVSCDFWLFGGHGNSKQTLENGNRAGTSVGPDNDWKKSSDTDGSGGHNLIVWPLKTLSCIVFDNKVGVVRSTLLDYKALTSLFVFIYNAKLHVV